MRAVMEASPSRREAVWTSREQSGDTAPLSSPSAGAAPPGETSSTWLGRSAAKPAAAGPFSGLTSAGAVALVAMVLLVAAFGST